MTRLVIGPFSWIVIPPRVSTALLLVVKTSLPFVAPERPLVGWRGAWPLVAWVAAKVSWGGGPVTGGVAMKGGGPLAWGSTCRTARRWLMWDMRGAVWPGWRRPPLAVVWFHFGRVWLKRILIRWPPVIETWLPLLSHQWDPFTNRGPSSTSGFPPVKRGLSWVALDISSTFWVWGVIPITWSNAMTISIRSEWAQGRKTKWNFTSNVTLQLYLHFLQLHTNEKILSIHVVFWNKTDQNLVSNSCYHH